MSLSYPSAPHLPDLHAFPTRRSSALRSSQAVADWLPQRLCLTHFGRIDDVASQLERVREGLRANAERARPGDRERFLASLEAEIDAEADGDTAERLRQAAPPEQLWLGLERYWRKRVESAT